MIRQTNTQEELYKASCLQISVDKSCNLIITDASNSDYQQIFVLIRKVRKDNEYIEDKTFSIKDRKSNSIVFKSIPDGYYRIEKYSVPMDISMPYFYKDGKFYKKETGIKDIEVSVEEIIESNPDVTGIKVDNYCYFSLCNLRKCFIKICQDILKQKVSICSSNNVDHSLTYKRDLLWSALNVIQYMVDMGQMDEAQRLLDELSGCNGLCPPSETSCNCGCRK